MSSSLLIFSAYTYTLLKGLEELAAVRASAVLILLPYKA